MARGKREKDKGAASDDGALKSFNTIARRPNFLGAPLHIFIPSLLAVVMISLVYVLLMGNFIWPISIGLGAIGVIGAMFSIEPDLDGIIMESIWNLWHRRFGFRNIETYHRP